MRVARTFALIAAALAIAMTSAAPAVAHHRPGHSGGPPTERPARAEDDRGPAHQDEGPRPDRALRGRALHGQILSISGFIWTISRSGHDQTIQVDVSGARVRWPGNRDATLSDFSVGDIVNIRLERTRQRGRDRDGAPGATTVLKAQTVRFVPAHGRADRDQDRFNGTVTAVSATSLTISTDAGLRTFTLTSDTWVRIGRVPVTVDQIRVGDRVRVSTQEGETIARQVVIRTRLDRFSGAVTAVSATSLTISTDDGLRTFTLNSQTAVRTADGQTKTLSDIQTNQRVRVSARDGETVALLVVIRS